MSDPTQEAARYALRQKLSGSLFAFKAMSPTERSQQASAGFAEEYNRTVDMANEMYPIQAKMFPPKAPIKETNVGGHRRWCDQTLAELFNWTAQMEMVTRS